MVISVRSTEPAYNFLINVIKICYRQYQVFEMCYISRLFVGFCAAAW
jgi:hypothetical protein